MKKIIVKLDKIINGKVSVSKLTGWKRKLKAKANAIELVRLAKEIGYSSIRF